MINIRIATESDIETLALLGRVTYTESHGKYIKEKSDLITYNNKVFSIKKIKEDLKDTNNLFYLAFVNDFPVGYTKIVFTNELKDITHKNSCRLERIYVLDEFIGMTIGKQLLNLLLKKVKQLKFNHIWLTVYIENYSAIEFYQKNEFKKIGKYTFDVENKGYENHVLSKKIN